MNAAQVHLAFNHFPVAGPILAFGVLLWGFFSKKDQIKMVGMALLIVSALGAVVVAQSGDGAEEIVEHKALVTKDLIHNHEEAADRAAVAIELTAALALAWLVMSGLKKNHLEKIYALVLIANLVSIALVSNAAHKGGQIRHDEIRDETKINSSALVVPQDNEKK